MCVSKLARHSRICLRLIGIHCDSEPSQLANAGDLRLASGGAADLRRCHTVSNLVRKICCEASVEATCHPVPFECQKVASSHPVKSTQAS